MNDHLQSITGWLDTHSGHLIRIQKKEQGDLDEVQMKVEQIGVHEDNTHAMDNYTGGDVLYIRGDGSVVQPEGNAALPGGTFLIPVAQLNQVHVDGNHLHLENERAAYDLTVLD
ncbi:hypothetical protein M3231_19345 [Neobacillus mesonae]|nr:hypothetical protein [Neobacillus mesonae]